jgi:hypothetical protein
LIRFPLLLFTDGDNNPTQQLFGDWDLALIFFAHAIITTIVVIIAVVVVAPSPLVLPVWMSMAWK